MRAFLKFLVLMAIVALATACKYRPANISKFVEFKSKIGNHYYIDNYNFSKDATYFVIFSGDVTTADINGDFAKVIVISGDEMLENQIKLDKIFKCNWARLSGDPKDHFNNLAFKISFEGGNSYHSFSKSIQGAKIELNAIVSKKVRKVYLMENKSG